MQVATTMPQQASSCLTGWMEAIAFSKRCPRQHRGKGVILGIAVAEKFAHLPRGSAAQW